MLPWYVLVLIAAVGGTVGWVVYLFRRGDAGRGLLTLRVTRFGGIVYAALTGIGTIVIVAQMLLAERVDVSLPVSTFWPKLYPTVEIMEGPTAEVVSGGFQVAEVSIAGLGLDARLLLAAGHALQGITFVVIGIVVAILCHRLLAGDPFRRMLWKSVNVGAASIAIGGIGWQVLFQLGGAVASTQALMVTGWSMEDSAVRGNDINDIGRPQPAMGWSVEFWPLFLGLALVAVGAAFRYGERLQRDMRGLV